VGTSSDPDSSGYEYQWSVLPTSEGSITTNRISDVLEEKRPKIICVDELDKMPRRKNDDPEEVQQTIRTVTSSIRVLALSLHATHHQWRTSKP